MKKVLAFLLTLAAAFSFAACGKKKNKTTKPVVTQGGDVEGNMIGNASFSYGEIETADSGNQLLKADNGGEWWLYGLDGGGGRFSISEDREAVVGVVATNGKMHGVQFAYDGFSITKGSKYLFEFDVKCNVARQFEVRIQQNGGLYENYLMGGKKGNLIENATTEWKHFKYEFESYVTNAAPRLALNLGAFDGDPDIDPAKLAAGEPTFIFSFDNFVLKCTQDSGEVIDPLNLAARPKICLNQVGYLPNQTKIALFKSDDTDSMDTDYYIIDVNTDELVKTGLTKVFGSNPASGEYIGIVDFTDFTTPGRYRIEGLETSSVEFEIGDDVYTGLTTDVIMMLYLQRCGTVSGAAGDKFAHEACHQDLAKLYTNPTTTIDVSGGWHDAGDYGKYVVAGAQTVADLLMTYEMMAEANVPDLFTYPSYVTNDSTIPDIIEEAMWELDWMLKMQCTDTTSADYGKVYHKVTSKEFPSNQILPQDDHSELYISPVSYAATADFAAVMAMAYRVLNANGIAPAKANAYKDAAILAYSKLSNSWKTSFKNPTDIKTGEYPDGDLNDELAWAAIELYAVTNTASYLTDFEEAFNKNYDLGLGWANVNGFAALTAAKVVSNTSETYQNIVDALITFANKLVFDAALDAYRTTIGEKTGVDDAGRPYTEVVYEWGSNLTIASNGMVLNLALKYIDDASDSVLTAFKDKAKKDEITNIKKYCKFANDVANVKTVDDIKVLYKSLVDEQLNYLLGANACCYCFVTGYGYKSENLTLTPVHPHHRPSIANGEPMKGMLVGGPDSNFEENGSDSVATRSCQGHAPAHCYIDDDNSWSTNEVTIYWNSPLIYLLIAVELANPAA